MASSIVSIDTDLEEMHNNIGELKKQVEVIHGGWERLTKSNTDLSSQMATIVQTLSRMEAWQRADKAAGKAVAGTSSQQDQVHPSIPVPIVGEHPLGYRGIANNLESRTDHYLEPPIQRLTTNLEETESPPEPSLLSGGELPGARSETQIREYIDADTEKKRQHRRKSKQNVKGELPAPERARTRRRTPERT
ncbi:hypothetical protein F2Q70_00031138 [Brassica cretica]|uniref:Uncharacterized protein n=1 Tax=Brassica cretica TaxID=69181 RepID=A0A8S9FPT7_BRACR|nr:hypothetical protein F2Q70_00031138 [Brassica cretica]